MVPEIDAVDVISLAAPLDEPFGYAQAWVEERTAVLVRITATDGTVGWGECWGPAAGTRETVTDFLAPRIEGKDPRAVTAIYDDLVHDARAAYQSIVPYPAISGVDLALWDLAGKTRDEPVASLLGSRRREAVRAYATGHYFRHGLALEDQFDAIATEAAGNAAALGAVKAKIGLSLLGHGPDEDVELVRRIRNAIGPDAALMVDANYAYDAGTARRVGRAIEPLEVTWFEEPVPPADEAGYAHLREALDLRIAGGECHTPAGFDRLFKAGGLDVAQPDLCNVGGLTAATRIGHRATAAGVPVVPHVWGTGIALAASLQFIATLPGEPWLEFDRSPNPLRTAVTRESFVPTEAGLVSIPDRPGIGITVDEGTLERYRTD